MLLSAFVFGTLFGLWLSVVFPALFWQGYYFWYDLLKNIKKSTSSSYTHSNNQK
jgi:hypothetical protein